MSAVLAAPRVGPAAPARRRAALLLMTASGFAALGCQLVWTQQAAVWLGHDTAAVLAVVAAFFGGLAIGARVLGGRITASARPAAGYAACELAVAVWAASLAFAMAPAGALLLRAIGEAPSPLRHWAVAFGGSFLLLLPATAAMGATLPAMDRLLGGSRLPGLYAANTVGAVVGVLATAFWLVPSIGLAGTAILCAALNLVCAAAGWGLRSDAPPPVPRPPGAPRAAAPLLLRLALTGLLGIGYEVLVVRVVSEVAENTVYTFALLLAVYLVGTAAGAAAYARAVRRAGGAGPWRDRLVVGLELAGVAGTAALWGAAWLKAAVASALDPGVAAALAGEAAVAVAAFLPPTLWMGALFAHLAAEARAAGIELARSLAVNTLGAAAAPLVFGVLVLPAIGPKLALLGVVAGYLLLLSPQGRRAPLAIVTAVAAAALALLAPPLAFVDVPEGGHLVSYREGAMAAVSVVEDAGGVRRLRIDDRQQEGDSASRVADARQALLPLLLHPAPRRALFLGLGTGVTASAAAEDASLQVEAVELLPEVAAAAGDVRPLHPRLHVHIADARRFVRAAGPRYDVVVADNFHPARAGSGALYTVEHFAAVRGRLADGGVFCQWLPMHQLDLPALRSIVAAFLVAFPDAGAMLATNSLDTPVLGLVGRAGGTRFDAAAVRRRLSETASLAHPPSELGLTDAFAVLGSVVGGPAALRRFASDIAVNTDDHPVVAALAPRLVYAPGAAPRDRLVALLGALAVGPDELVGASGEPGLAGRLAAYRSARDRFLDAGRAVRPTADVRGMLAQVEAPLLSVLRTSADFRPAYDPLLRMAAALADTDVDAARTLLARLEALQPDRPEAAALRRRLGASSP